MEAPTTDRRADQRRRSLLGGSISVAPAASATECLLRDVSEAGARLTVSETIPLPTAFDLTIAHWRQTRLARLVWRRGDCAGVTFAQAQGDAARLPPASPQEGKDSRAQNAALRAELAAMRGLEV